MHQGGLGRLWEILALLVIGGLIVRALVDFLLPLVPYIAGAVLIAGIAATVYYRRQRW